MGLIFVKEVSAKIANPFMRKGVYRMTKTKRILEIMRKKKCDRNIMEQCMLKDWIYNVFGTPIRIIVFPVALLVKLYKWTYSD